ncbi:MAG: electron transport complex protein RnfA [Firmicutes bacterium HGW-Firmicutes-21]|nr:MAG: electron transport complex protein RnfA [Firmicutes bacterium HGW-Firmicutes-21]
MLKALIAVFIAATLTENYILTKFLGICPFLGVSKKLNTAIGMSLAVIFVMLLATVVTYPVYMLVLLPNELDYLQTILFILVIAALVQLVEIILKKYIPSLYKSLGVYLPLITTNCAVLGVTILVIDKSGADYGFAHAVVNALGAGFGYLVAMVLFSGIRERLEDSDIPDFFKGMPITLISASFVALSFLGFQGIVDKLI